MRAGYLYEIRSSAGEGWSAHPPVARLALAVGLGAQGVLLALHLIAAQVTVDRRRPALPPHDCFALPTFGALNPLRFNRHFSPLSDRHAGIIENLRDGCQAPPFSPLKPAYELTTMAQELVVRTSQLPPVHLKMLPHAAVARMGA